MSETIANYTVPEHHVKMFTDNVQRKLTKMGSNLSAYVSTSSYRGERAQAVNFLGPAEFTERVTPYQDTEFSQLEHTSRWILGREYDCTIPIDRLDTLKMIYDPTSPYVQRMYEAAARKMDEIIVEAFFAKAKTGKNGTTDTAFKTANTVPHSASGLTIGKLRETRKLMKKRHVPLGQMRAFIAVTADEIDDMLASAEATPAAGTGASAVSYDFNSVRPLVDGEISSFMGFTFVPYEDSALTTEGKSLPRVTGATTTQRYLPVWVPDGMHFGTWQNLTITISTRPDKNNIKQAHATFTIGATRLEEDQVFRIESQFA